MEMLNNQSYSSLILDGVQLDRMALLKRSGLAMNDPTIPVWEKEFYGFLSRWLDNSPVVEIETSGTTGQPRKLEVEKKRMIVSAKMTGHVLNLAEGDITLLCLPVRFIAGMMMIVRAFVLGLNLMPRKPAGNPLPYLDRHYDFTAMTPMQVWEILRENNGAEKLGSVDKVIIGGGPVPASLPKQLKTLKNRIWHTYGMTETLTHIALRRINSKNASEWFTPLPGVTVRPGEENTLVIEAPGICSRAVMTDDIAEFDQKGRFRILGRRDHLINSGGLKCNPEVIEQILSETVSIPFFVSGWPDERLGEKIVLFVENTEADHSMATQFRRVLEKLPDRRMFPRAVCTVSRFFRTSSGKIRRKETVSYYLAHPAETSWRGL